MDVVDRILEYARERFLAIEDEEKPDKMTKIKIPCANDKPKAFLQIQTEPQKKRRELVLQFRWLNTWVQESDISELEMELRGIITDPKPHFPAISFERLSEDEVFDAVIAAFDRFLNRVR